MADIDTGAIRKAVGSGFHRHNWELGELIGQLCDAYDRLRANAMADAIAVVEELREDWKTIAATPTAKGFTGGLICGRLAACDDIIAALRQGGTNG